MSVLETIVEAWTFLALALAGWDGWRRALAHRASESAFARADQAAERSLIEKRLAVEDAFEGIKLEFESHKARFAKLTKDTEQSIENLAASMDLAVKKLEGQMAAGELKANMQSGRRIG